MLYWIKIEVRAFLLFIFLLFIDFLIRKGKNAGGIGSHETAGCVYLISTWERFSIKAKDASQASTRIHPLWCHPELSRRSRINHRTRAANDDRRREFMNQKFFSYLDPSMECDERPISVFRIKKQKHKEHAWNHRHVHPLNNIPPSPLFRQRLGGLRARIESASLKSNSRLHHTHSNDKCSSFIQERIDLLKNFILSLLNALSRVLTKESTRVLPLSRCRNMLFFS